MDTFDLIATLIKVVGVFSLTMLGIMAMTLAERRISAFMQYRLGPNRVGPGGMFQPIADGIKFFMKEAIIPDRVNVPLYLMAPVVTMVPALMTFAVIPFGPDLEIMGRVVPMQVANINIGVLYILGLTSVGVYGLVLAGWSSGNKYSLLGGLRSSAQLISYELAMGLAIVAVILMTSGLTFNEIIDYQINNGWNFWKQPLAALIFLIAIYAETNRLPFDLTEAEQELVGGYHTEYSGFKFAMFFLSEYANMITASAFMVVMFFGGWDIPFVDESTMGVWGTVLGSACFLAKMGFFLFMYIWVRWTFPRFRYDQLMKLGWQVLLPLGLLNILITAIVTAMQI